MNERKESVPLPPYGSAYTPKNVTLPQIETDKTVLDPDIITVTGRLADLVKMQDVILSDLYRLYAIAKAIDNNDIEDIIKEMEDARADLNCIAPDTEATVMLKLNYIVRIQEKILNATASLINVIRSKL